MCNSRNKTDRQPTIAGQLSEKTENYRMLMINTLHKEFQLARTCGRDPVLVSNKKIKRSKSEKSKWIFRIQNRTRSKSLANGLQMTTTARAIQTTTWTRDWEARRAKTAACLFWMIKGRTFCNWTRTRYHSLWKSELQFNRSIPHRRSPLQSYTRTCSKLSNRPITRTQQIWIIVCIKATHPITSLVAQCACQASPGNQAKCRRSESRPF